jgi:hypothetical protein
MAKYVIIGRGNEYQPWCVNVQYRGTGHDDERVFSPVHQPSAVTQLRYLFQLMRLPE